MLSESLKKFMTQKPLSKVTISEIILDCGINRNTFYYHFKDIYALLKWMLEQEAVQVIKQFDLLINPEDAIIFALNYVKENKHILNCAFDTMGRAELKRFFYADFMGICRSIIDGVEKEFDLHTDENYKQFLCEFYTEGIAGLLISEIMAPNEKQQKKILQYLTVFMKASLPAALASHSI